jgi:cell division FtsZ-interacting protein ZapD
MGNVVGRTEEIAHLVISAGGDRLLERYDIRSELAKPLNQDRPALRPLPVPTPQVDRGNVHAVLA